MTYDYSKFKKDDGPGDNALSAITHKAQEQAQAEAEVARLEEELDEAKKKLREISWHELPKLMDDLGIPELTLDSGLVVKVGEDIRASIPKAHEAKAFAFLEENNQAGMIKRQFVIEFAREEETWANKFERDLKQRKKPLNVKRKKSVPPQTLSAWVRKELEVGKELPLDLLGVFRQRVSKVKMKD